jgi:RNA polymerase sigma-70 factor (ECF subfamily)
MKTSELVAAGYQANRPALRGYLVRLVVQEAIAEELLQETALKALQQPSLPAKPDELRAWLFRVATNLALDFLRRERTWGTGVLSATRSRALLDEAFLAESKLMVGSPELTSIAKDHLAVCFACTLRALPSEQSAALLLKEIYDFTLEEVADVMGASFGQAKAWVQAARSGLRAKYAQTCALVAQQGACFQCVELDQFFGARQGDPLEGSDRSLDARFALVRQKRELGMGPWHRQMVRLVSEVLDGEPEQDS